VKREGRCGCVDMSESAGAGRKADLVGVGILVLCKGRMNGAESISDALHSNLHQ
jgi:hypothetical protein